MGQVLKTVGKIAQAVAPVLAFVPGLQPFAAAAADIGTVATTVGGLLSPPEPPAGSPDSSIIDVSAATPYIMGRVRSGGVLVHDVAYGAEYKDIPNPNRSLVYVYSDCGPVEEVEGFSSDGAFINTQGDAGGYYGARMNFRSQTGLKVEPSALSGSQGSIPNWGSSYKLSSKAAGLFSLRWDKNREIFQGGLPDLTATVRGVKVYDPRFDDTAPGGQGPQRLGLEASYQYSTNPAAHAVTYLYGRYVNGVKIFGVGMPRAGIDLPAFIAWANVCEANNWEINGRIFEPADKFNNYRLILEAGSARPAHSNGLISVAYNAPKISLGTFTQDDLAEGDIEIPATQGIREKTNSIIPRYMSPAHNWEYVPTSAIQSQQYIDADGELFRKELQYSFVTNPTQAAQLAGYDLVNARELSGITIPMKPKVRAIPAGELITLDMPDIGLQGDFEIVNKQFSPLDFTVIVTLKSISVGRDAFALGSTATPPLVPSLRFGPDYDDTVFRAGGLADTSRLAAQASYVQGITIVGHGDGSVDISSHTREIGGSVVALEAGSIEGLNLDTLYYVYYDDEEGEGGAVVYQATETESEAQRSVTNGSRYYVGYIVTPPTAQAASSSGFGATPPTASVPLPALTVATAILQQADAQLQAFVNQSVSTLSAADAAQQIATDEARASLEAADQTLQTSITALNTALNEAQLQLADADTILQDAINGVLQTNEEQQIALTSLVASSASTVGQNLAPNGDISNPSLWRSVSNAASYLSPEDIWSADVDGAGNPGFIKGAIGFNWMVGLDPITIEADRKYKISVDIKRDGVIANSRFVWRKFSDGSNAGSTLLPTVDSNLWETRAYEVDGSQLLQSLEPGTTVAPLTFGLSLDHNNTGNSTGEIRARKFKVEDVTDLSITNSRIDTLDIVSGEQATSIQSLETESLQIASSISNINQTTDAQAQQITNLQTENSSQSASITALTQTTDAQALTQQQLLTSSGDNSSNISLLQQTDVTQAQQISSLSATAADNTSRLGLAESVNESQASSILSLQTASSNQESDITTLLQTTALSATSILALETILEPAPLTPNGLIKTQDNMFRNIYNNFDAFPLYDDMWRDEYQGDSGVMVNETGANRVLRLPTGPYDDTKTYVVRARVWSNLAADNLLRIYADVVANEEGTTANRIGFAKISSIIPLVVGWNDILIDNLTVQPGGSFITPTIYMNRTSTSGAIIAVSELYIEDVDNPITSLLSRIEQTESTSAGNASQLNTIATEAGDNSSAISLLQNTSVAQALQLTNLGTTIGSNSSSIQSLQTTTSNQATTLSTLSNDVGGNSSSISTLNTVTNGHASQITTLEGDVSQAVAFTVTGGELSLNFIGGVGTTARINADFLLLEGTILGAHILDLEIGTEKISPFAVNKNHSVTMASNINLNLAQNVEQLLMTVPVDRALSDSALKVNASIRQRPGNTYWTRYRLKVTSPNGATTTLDTVDSTLPQITAGGVVTVRGAFPYSREFANLLAQSGIFTFRLYSVHFAGGNSAGFHAAGSYMEVTEIKK